MLQKKIRLSTHGEGEIVNITSEIEEVVLESGIKAGIVTVFVTGSTAAVTTIEYEDGVLLDFLRALSVIAPDTISYAHNARWGDGNGRSHVKASFIGPSISIPVEHGALLCGTWQQVVFVELDVRPGRDRTIIVTVWGE
jgi:secondary thiamine-phosphate synthase enzyme